MKIEHIKDLIQSCNINLLVGSGCSTPYLSTLHNIEGLLSDLEKENQIERQFYDVIKASIYNVYCKDVILKNMNSEIFSAEGGKRNSAYVAVLDDYKKLLISLNEILLYRHNTLLSKQINLFTTNVDLFFEISLEENGLEFNDGFKGRIEPTYDLSNFQKSYTKVSAHYENVSEIPVFNLLKVHGSINWRKHKDNIIACHTLWKVENIKGELSKFSEDEFLKIDTESNIAKLLEEAKKITEFSDFRQFFDRYEELLIVNPTKAKFKETVFDEHYYELLRIYANSLEKENTILFALGFSFRDEHIRSITRRAADSNPTLKIIVFSYSNDEKEKIFSELKLTNGMSRNNNISVITPKEFIEENSIDEEKVKENTRSQIPLSERLKNFDCKSITQEVFQKVKDKVKHKKQK